jgi:hypothetical protein
MATRLKGIPNLPFAPIVAAMFGLGAAAFVFAIPVYYVERATDMIGLANIIPQARAPLGTTAQALIAAVAALATFVAVWIVLRPVEHLFKRRKDDRKARSFTVGRKQPGSMPDADDEPLSADEAMRARKPIFAEAELGAPLMSDAALASGGGLLVETPAPRASVFEEERPLDLTPMFEEQAPEAAPLAVSEPAPVEPVAYEAPVQWLTPDQVAAEEVPEEVPEEVVQEQPILAAVPPAPVEEVAPIVEPSPVVDEAPVLADEQPSLREMLVRFENALKKRREQAAVAQTAAAPFPDEALNSLRDLMAANRAR